MRGIRAEHWPGVEAVVFVRAPSSLAEDPADQPGRRGLRACSAASARWSDQTIRLYDRLPLRSIMG